jgi:hypothetical protein
VRTAGSRTETAPAALQANKWWSWCLSETAKRPHETVRGQIQADDNQ